MNLVKIKVKSFKNSKVNAQKWKFFRKFFDAIQRMDRKLINMADQIKALRPGLGKVTSLKSKSKVQKVKVASGKSKSKFEKVKVTFLKSKSKF